MQPHQPVLVEQTLDVLSPKLGECYIDATAGFGGHARAVQAVIGAKGHMILLDTDPEAVEYLRQHLSGKNTEIVHTNFAEYDWKPESAELILMDLGVSSAQLDRAERGFSFLAEAKLDMRMNPTQELSAYEVVNHYPEADLADIIYQYGEERRSRAVARAIVHARAQKPIETTTELAAVVQSVVKTKTRINPATKTFQAIRIEVNQELAGLEKALPRAAEALTKGGRLAVISFHSLEDRMVKHYFKTLTTPTTDPVTGAVTIPAQFQLVTKKPLSGLNHDNNPRARSAKLRCVEKII